MQDFEFPQAIVDVQHITCFRFEYENGWSDICSLENPDEFLNETVPTDKPITVILNDDSFYCGALAGLEDDMGVIMVKIRSIVSPSCVVSIPVEKILGWCIMPEHHES